MFLRIHYELYKKCNPEKLVDSLDVDHELDGEDTFLFLLCDESQSRRTKLAKALNAWANVLLIRALDTDVKLQPNAK